MKKLIILTSLMGVLFLSGCDNEDARNYAKELVGVLKTYQVEVNKKIGAEQKSYKDLAANYSYAREFELFTELRSERRKRAEGLADALLSDEKLTPADLKNLVADYANFDFEATRKMLEEESDGQVEYLASLESLELQSQNITALRKTLEALAKPKSDIKQLKQLASSAKEFKAKFDELQCEDLAQEIACLKKRLEAIKTRTDLDDAQKKAATESLQKEINSLTELGDDQKCDAKKREDTKCPEAKG